MAKEQYPNEYYVRVHIVTCSIDVNVPFDTRWTLKLWLMAIYWQVAVQCKLDLGTMSHDDGDNGADETPLGATMIHFDQHLMLTSHAKIHWDHCTEEMK